MIARSYIGGFIQTSQIAVMEQLCFVYFFCLQGALITANELYVLNVCISLRLVTECCLGSFTILVLLQVSGCL